MVFGFELIVLCLAQTFIYDIGVIASGDVEQLFKYKSAENATQDINRNERIKRKATIRVNSGKVLSNEIIKSRKHYEDEDGGAGGNVGTEEIGDGDVGGGGEGDSGGGDISGGESGGGELGGGESDGGDAGGGDTNGGDAGGNDTGDSNWGDGDPGGGNVEDGDGGGGDGDGGDIGGGDAGGGEGDGGTEQEDNPMDTDISQGLVWTYGIIPYLLDNETYAGDAHMPIFRGIAIIEDDSCLLFQKITSSPTGEGATKPNYLHFTNPAGLTECAHNIAENSRSIWPGEKKVTFGYECMEPWEIAHEILHALNLIHETSHPERNEFVIINWENIIPAYYSQFKIEESISSILKLPYDYHSIMHLTSRSFSKNGRTTIESADPNIDLDSPRTRLSILDKKKIDALYGSECNKRLVDGLLEKCQKN